MFNTIQYYCTECEWEGTLNEANHFTLKQLKQYNLNKPIHGNTGQICPNCNGIFSIIDTKRIPLKTINNIDTTKEIKFSFKSKSIEISETIDLPFPNSYNNQSYLNMYLNKEYDNWLSNELDKNITKLDV